MSFLDWVRFLFIELFDVGVAFEEIGCGHWAFAFGLEFEDFEGGVVAALNIECAVG